MTVVPLTRSPAHHQHKGKASGRHVGWWAVSLPSGGTEGRSLYALPTNISPARFPSHDERRGGGCGEIL